MNFHRLSKYFPLLEGEEFELFKQDIEKNGQLEPIVLFKGEILDGANRYRACLALGVEPRFEEYKGSDPLGYVVSTNIRRRHLDVSQRSMIATEMLPEFEAEAKERKSQLAKEQRGEDGLFRSTSSDGKRHDGEAATQAARIFGVSGPSVQRAKRIKEQAPEKVEAIIKGETTVSAVDAELRAARASERAQEKKSKRMNKELEERPHEVAEFLDATKAYQSRVEMAISATSIGKFSPEAASFTIRKLDDLSEHISNLKEVLGGVK